METQQDHNVRVVALTNLRAMCKRVSGFCHRFEVEKVTRTRCYVSYSNPDEYGHESPMIAVFPIYPSGWPDDAENPRVVLEILTVQRDNWHGEGWQAFSPLLDCPVLYRATMHDDCPWETAEEVDVRLNPWKFIGGGRLGNFLALLPIYAPHGSNA